MARPVHLVSKGVPGYGHLDGRCLPCSGVAGRTVGMSSKSFGGDSKIISQAKIVSLKCASRGVGFVCKASSGGRRRNPEFSRQNKHGFSRSRNKQNEGRDGSDNLEESDFFSSKNGPLLSLSSTSKFQATATPGPREKEIVELFRKVQAQLRERAAIKEEKKNEDLQGRGKDSETVNSLLKLLRKHTVQQGKKTSNRSSRDFILDQAGESGQFNEEKNMNLSNSNNTVKDEDEEREFPSFSRPISKFQRRSPIPQVKFRSIYSDENTVDSVSDLNLGGKRGTTRTQPGIIHEPELEVEPEPMFSDGDELSEDETSDADEGDNDDVSEHEPTASSGLRSMKLPELRALAKSRGMKGFSKLKKQELLELLSGGSI